MVFGLIIFFLFLVFIGSVVLSIMIELPILIFVALALFILLIMILGVLQGAVDTVIRVLMLYYASTGKTPEFLTVTDIARVKE